MASDEGKDFTQWRASEETNIDSPKCRPAALYSDKGSPKSMEARSVLESAIHAHAQFLQLNGHDERSKSWPATARNNEPFSVLQRRIKSFKRRSQRIDAGRNEALAIRSELKFLRKNYRQQHKFVDESQKKLNEHIELVIKSDDFVTTRDDLIVLYGHARADYLDLTEQSGKLQALEDRLADLDVSLQAQEKLLSQNAERILGLLRHLDPATRDEGEEQEAPILQGAPTDQFSTEDDADYAASESSLGHPLLEEYFEVAGDVTVAKQRLTELLKEQQEQRTHRIFQEDQGMVLEETESAFEARCASERENADRNIQAAILLKDQLRSRCLATGIDPDKHRHAGSQDHEIEDVSSQDGTHRVRLHLNYGRPASIPVILTEAGEFGDVVEVDQRQISIPEVAQNVKRWIDRIDGESIEPLLDHVNTMDGPQQDPDATQVSDWRKELEQYLIEHGSAKIFTKLAAYGIELPFSSKEEFDRIAIAANSTLSNHSRSSSESELGRLIKAQFSYSELLAEFGDLFRGRQP